MIDKRKYVLILGAGASYPYDFPIGRGLYSMVRHDSLKKLEEFVVANEGSIPRLARVAPLARKLSESLGKTSIRSIDQFLNVNSDFLLVGTVAISTAIYCCECESLRPYLEDECSRDWYSRLFDKMTEGLYTADDLLRVHENQISFITFNYDRSLENFLFESLYGFVSNAGKSQAQVAEAINKIDIVHVYGKVGDLPWQKGIFDPTEPIVDINTKVACYGDKRLNPVAVAYYLRDSIQLMRTERRESSELLKARCLIAEADKIMFLGFGFAQENLDILGIPGMLKDKHVYGTAFGLGVNEMANIKHAKLGYGEEKGDSCLSPCDCLDLIKEHLH